MVKTLTTESLKSLRDVRTWFDSALGQNVMQIEGSILDQLLSGYFGYHLLQTGVFPQALYDASPIRNKILLGLDTSDSSPLIAKSTELPFLDNSIDVIISHHLLEFLDRPLDTLRELARVSLPMGYFVVIGFNPISLWGLWKSAAGWNGKPPWFGKFIRPGRLMDWLNALNFKIDRVQYCIYGLPISPNSLRTSDSSRELSRNINLPLGAVYVLVARKQESTMTAITQPWHSRGLKLIQGGRLNPAIPPVSRGAIFNERN
ncbi:MAG: SAM-dependent methyltransferase [Gammaproteobacteria bacterium TMED1]|nr:MAG: SAM-dependent methyltransferase [Gammaproteobacteria bacterium TMED1]